MPRLRASFNSIVTTIFLAGLFVYYLNNRSLIDELLSVSIYAVSGLILLKTIRIFINGLFTKFTLDAFDKNITYGETNYLSLITSLGNFFGPVLGGASIRAIYLKKKHDFQYSKFVSTLYGYYVVAFLTNSLIGIMVLLTYTGPRAEDSVPALLILFSVLVMTSVLLFLPTIILHKIVSNVKIIPKKLTANFLSAISGWDILKNNKKLIAKLFLLNLLILTVAVGESWILYSLFAADYSLANVVLYTVLGTLSVLISFTPGALGIKEAIYVFTSSVLLLDTNTILQMATVDRSVVFILLLVMYGLVKIFRLDNKLPAKADEEIQTG